MPRVRPTLRCLRDDLSLAIPPQDQPLDEVSHPLVAKANEQFADVNDGHERIAVIDDNVFIKVKVQRWRGAVWEETQHAWLVAAGLREDGSADDFYAVLAANGRAARKSYNASRTPSLTTDTYTASLLPAAEDRDRYAAESDIRFDRLVDAAVCDLARRSLSDGREHTAAIAGFSLGIQVRADDGHLSYVAVRIIGSVPAGVIGTILDAVPGCELQDWGSETRMPNRPLRPNEQAFSNIMDPVAAAKLLEVD